MTANDALITAAGVQAFATVVLAVITGIYAQRTFAISKATKRQANASVKMAEEMRKQRVMASRPVIIQEAIHRKYQTERNMADYFQIYNAGNGPAIELEMSILNEKKILIPNPNLKKKQTALRSDESPIQFQPLDGVDLEESIYYLVCEYQGILEYPGILPHFPKQMWYQTWLPFELKKSSETGKAIIVEAGKLKFEEVTEKERINAFGGGKPQ